VNANGEMLPNFFIFKGKQKNELPMENKRKRSSHEHATKSMNDRHSVQRMDKAFY